MKKEKNKGKVFRNIFLGLLLLIAVFLLGTTIWNRVLCIRENKILQKVGTEVTVNGVSLRVSVEGKGNKTIVLLSGLGTPCPIIDFKPLADRLSDSYRVVTVEYTGYGLSKDADVDKSNQAIVGEIREVLRQLKIKPPYILMPHSISGVYCMQYLKMYPAEVEAMIGIDASVPNQGRYGDEQNVSEGIYVLARFMDMTGLNRLSNLFGNPMIQEMEAGGNYSRQDMAVIKAVMNQKQVTRALFHEVKKMPENMKSLYDMKLPADKPVLYILSKESCIQMKQELKKRGYHATWDGLHKEVISNSDIQKINYLDGQHYLQWTQPDKIAEMTKKFLQKYE